MRRALFAAFIPIVVACGESRPPVAQPPAEPLQVGSSPDAAAAEPHDASVTLGALGGEGPVGELGDGGSLDADGIGLGNVGSLGHGAGPGTGGGNPWGTIGGGGARSSPSLRQGKTEVNGRLPPEVIQRIVRQNFGRFRLCYEKALRAKPDLAGTVRTKFVIERDGSVKDVKDDKSDLKDPAVVACVTKAFANLSFPQPESGVVTVVYPIIFIPPDADPAAPKASSSAAPKPPPKK